jgi:hypothetical protein
MKRLLLSVAAAALFAGADPALANFTVTPGTGITIFAIDSSNQGTSLCAAASTECSSAVLINTGGAPLGVSANPLVSSLAAGSQTIGAISNTSFGISGSLPGFASTPTVNVGTMPNVVLGAGSAAIGSISNTAFGISGSLPAFAATPTFNVGTMPNVVLGAGAATIGAISNTSFTATQATGTNLHMVCDSGCSSSSSPNYGATFPTTGTPIGAEYLASAPSYATSGQMQPLWVNNGGLLEITGANGTFPISGSISNTSFGISGTLPAFAATPTVNIGTMPNVVLAAGSAAIGSISNTSFGISGTLPAFASTPSFNFASQYPAGATAVQGSATGTTSATSATLAATAGKTNYVCSISIRANATAAATGNATLSDGTKTFNYTQWTAPLASGLGVIEPSPFEPCYPASAANTAWTLTSAAPGTGGVVSVAISGYQM